MKRFNFVLVLRMGLLALVCFLVLYPLGMLLFSSFKEAMPGLPSGYSLKGYISVYLDPDTYEVIWTTVWIAVIKAVLSVGLAIIFAWVIHRTNTVGRRVLDTILHLNFFILSPLPVILGWVLIFAPNSGIVNQWFASFLGGPLFNIYSSWGIIFVGIGFSASVYYIFLAPAFRSMDATLEEAAMANGASGFNTVRKIVLPLLAPAILATLLLSLIQGMEMFSAPIFLGTPANIQVMSTKIFDYIHLDPPDYASGTAMAVTLLVITFLLVLVQWRILGRRQFVTITGKGYRPQPMDLGRWRWPVFASAILVLFILSVPPFILLIQTTFMKVAGLYGPDMYTLSNYINSFNRPTILDALKNTIILGVVVATAGVIICTLVSYVVVKTKWIEKRVLDVVTWLPFSVPALVMGMAFLWAYIYLPLPFGITLYGTLAALVLVCITKNLTIGVKGMSSTIIQISSELEESALVHGVSWTQTFLHIWAPLLKNGLISVWVMLFCFAIRDLESVILLYSPTSRVLSTLFYELWDQGKLEVASVIGFLQAAIIIAGYLVVTLLGRIGKIKEYNNEA